VSQKTNSATTILSERWGRDKQFLGRYISKILTWEPNNKDVLYFMFLYDLYLETLCMVYT